MPPLTKTCPKMVLPIKGVAFLTETVFEKKFSGAGEGSERRTIGRYLSRRRRLSPRQLERALSPFAPFRGLAAFYLAVDWRLQQRDSLARQPLKGSANDRSR
jgi:hypothetical protein